MTFILFYASFIGIASFIMKVNILWKIVFSNSIIGKHHIFSSSECENDVSGEVGLHSSGIEYTLSWFLCK